MRKQPTTLTIEDAMIALKNDYQELLNAFGPYEVEISDEPVRPGVICVLKVHVFCLHFILGSQSDMIPEPAWVKTYYFEVPEGYPQV